jgi:hypothetical protein
LNSISTENGGAAVMEAPIIITFRRTAQAVVYPLFYRQTVNNQPTEEIRGLTLFEDLQTQRRCAATTDNNGLVVPFGDRVLFCSMFTTSNSVMRNGVPGNLFGQVYTESCLRFDSTWYDAFTIGSSTQAGNIYVDVSVFNSTSGQRQNSTITLSSSETSGISSDGTVLADLVGTFAPYKAVPDLTQMMFFYPSRPIGGDREREGFAGSMLLPLSLVDLEGRSPDKVGVSFEGFLRQGSACENPAGSGLQGQLDEYYKRDSLRVGAGLAPNYFASPKFDYILNSSLFGSSTSPGQSHSLVYWVPDPPNSLVRRRKAKQKKKNNLVSCFPRCL